MSNPYYQDVNAAGAPDPVTPREGVSDTKGGIGYAQITPPGHGPAPAPYDISAPQEIAGITAGLDAATSLAGAGVLYPKGPRQAETEAFLHSPQGYGAVSITDGFPDYENTDVAPGANMANPDMGQGGGYPGTTQGGLPLYGGGEGTGVSGVTPEHGNMGPSSGGGYPGTTQSGVRKYGTS